MPPKKGKKQKKQDDNWGEDNGIEEKIKNLMEPADSANGKSQVANVDICKNGHSQRHDKFVHTLTKTYGSC